MIRRLHIVVVFSLQDDKGVLEKASRPGSLPF